MKKFLIILNSTIFMVLFCFTELFSLPLTRTCYTTSENKINMSLNEEFVYIKNLNRKDNFSFNLGIPGDTSVGLDFSLIHYKQAEADAGKPGDILFNIWHYTGDYLDGALASGFTLVFRIPTGPDAYTDERVRNLSFGNSELKIMPVLSFNLNDKDRLIINLSYTFREGKGESLYSGFKVNLLKSDTYKSCFGFNPFYKDAFMDGDNLKNDYAAISAGIITSRLYPWILFAEIYYSSAVYNGKYQFDNINIEGSGVNPLLLSSGLKYFFSDSLYCQFSDSVDLLQNDGFIKNTLEFSLNIFF